MLLRQGTYYTSGEVLGPEHSGLTIQNYEGEHAVVSGGVPLDNIAWKPFKVQKPSPPQWKPVTGMNNVYDRAQPRESTGDIVYLGSFQALADCLAAANASDQGPFGSATYHTPQFPGEYSTLCYGTTSQYWAPTAEAGIISAQNMAPWPSNVWSADLSSYSLDDVLGLRLNGARAVRAKYPNGNPELSGPKAADMMQYNVGWVDSPTTWVKPADKWNATKDIVVNGSSWPGVNWPASEEGGSTWTGEGVGGRVGKRGKVKR